MASEPELDLCAIPAVPPPDGQAPNFLNPATLAPVNISISLILTVWAVLFVAVRLHVNWFKLQAADYLMTVAAALSVTYTGLVISKSRYNRHPWDVPDCWYDVRYAIILFVQSILSAPVFSAPKCAILLTYRQLFQVSKSASIAIWIGLIFAIIIPIPGVVMEGLIAAPKPGHSWQQFLYDASEDETYARSQIMANDWGIVRGTCAVVLNLHIFIIPLPAVYKSSLPLKKKLQIFAFFATALSAVVASIIALVFRVRFLFGYDLSWQQAEVDICNVVETNVAIIAGSTPAFAKFTRSYLAGSSAVHILWSKLCGSTNDRSDDSPATAASPFVGTIGSPPRKHLRHYYELTDTALMETRASGPIDKIISRVDIADQEEAGIIRTVDIYQESRPDSYAQPTAK